MEVITSLHESLNFKILPKQRQCFYENFVMEAPTRSIEVFAYSGGDAAITLTIHGPLEYKDMINEDFESPIRTDFINTKKEKVSETQTYMMEFTAQNAGTYAFCLDNRKAHFFPQFLQIDVYHGDLTKGTADPNVKKILGEATEKKEELQESLSQISKIYRGIIGIQRQQLRDRYRLALHSASNQHNYNHAFYGSLLETAIFILVACFQIYFVRRWFSSKINRNKK